MEEWLDKQYFVYIEFDDMNALTPVSGPEYTVKCKNPTTSHPRIQSTTKYRP